MTAPTITITEDDFQARFAAHATYAINTFVRRVVSNPEFETAPLQTIESERKRTVEGTHVERVEKSRKPTKREVA